MKILSEKDIQKLAANAKEVVTEAGAKVQAFKYQRPEKPTESKKEPKFAWLKSYLGGIMAGIQAGAHENKVLNGLVAQIVKVLNDKLPVQMNQAGAVVEAPKKWTFTVKRDSRGFIEQIEAIRKD
jgi:hypothetical protein